MAHILVYGSDVKYVHNEKYAFLLLLSIRDMLMTIGTNCVPYAIAVLLFCYKGSTSCCPFLTRSGKCC